MKLTGRRNGRARGGWALLMCVFATFMGVTLVSVMMMSSISTARSSERTRNVTTASYMAEGAIEAGKEGLITAIANFDPVPTGGVVKVNGVDVPYVIEPTGFITINTDPSGIQTLVTGYSIQATARYHGYQAIASRILNAEATPIFQFAVFYTNDLEIGPGPNMTLGGRVHTNADMYLGSNSTLTIDTNYLRSVGHMYRNRKDDPTVSSGTVKIRQWVVDPFDPSEPVKWELMNSGPQMSVLGVPTTSGYDSNFVDGWDPGGDGFGDPGDWLPWDLGALDFWKEPDGYTDGAGYTVLSAEHGVDEAVTPSIGSIAMFEAVAGGDYELDPGTGEYYPVPAGTGSYGKGYYHENADLSIVGHEDGTWSAYDGAGLDVSSSLVGVVTVDEFFDARQADPGTEKIKVIEIDMAALNASGEFPPNGLVYAASYGMGEGADAKGVKLFNGSELASGLTVVTEGSMYVEGDYNTTAKKGAAVIADAVNLLSNAWDDSKTPGTLPAASDTTFNLAFITGNHDTEGSQYNGGLENLPRFHEKWTGKDCNINGSFVNAWSSQFATGLWKYGSDRYTAPARNWFYDEDFNDVSNLPPFTPMAVSGKDVVAY